eukprot:TRINITY_DN6932_c0_g3_i1.p1 TRINITY_DN6932_c0_g3~~TRINITY_DN6932_c0_g3_i1.p1  ORF type:complete len:332 (+),score=73.07 TRINITY_DN6932_c0_g3_i1:82-1077(+)
MVSVLVLVITLPLLLVGYLFYARQRNERLLSHIPTPGGGHPIFGYAKEMRTGKTGKWTGELIKKYGRVVRYRFLWYDYIMISDPEMVKQVLLTKEHHFTKQFFLYEMVASIFGKEGLVTITDVDHHKFTRKLVAQAFTYSNLKLYFPIFTGLGQKLLSRWDKCASSDTRVEVSEDLSLCTMDIIGRAAFGIDFNALSSSSSSSSPSTTSSSITTTTTSKEHDGLRADMENAFMNLGEGGMDFIPILGNYTKSGRMRAQARARVADHLKSIIINKQTHPDDHANKDLLDILIDAKDENGASLDMTALADQCVTFLIAGHETTSGTLTWLSSY